MRAFLNVRLLLITLAVLLLLGGGILAAAWYTNRPAVLLHSAGVYHQRGVQALAGHDDVAARRDFQSADNQLGRLLAQQPQHSAGLLLRYRVLWELAALTAEEEQATAGPGQPSRAREMARNSLRCLVEAAAD